MPAHFQFGTLALACNVDDCDARQTFDGKWPEAWAKSREAGWVEPPRDVTEPIIVWCPKCSGKKSP